MPIHHVRRKWGPYTNDQYLVFCKLLCPFVEIPNTWHVNVDSGSLISRFDVRFALAEGAGGGRGTRFADGL